MADNNSKGALIEFLKQLRIRADADSPDPTWVLDELERKLGGEEGIRRLDELIHEAINMTRVVRVNPGRSIHAKLQKDRAQDRVVLNCIDLGRVLLQSGEWS